MHLRVRIASIALVAVASLLAGCAAPVAQSAGAAPMPSSTPATRAPGRPAPSTPAPAAVSRACRTNADCAVKDVGSCCGYFPACVSKDARTDPAAVQAQCAAGGMAGVCGFREVTGCSCVAGTCQDSTGGATAVDR